MKFYLAPMEGITGFIYRNAYAKHFGHIDKYFTPFIVPNRSRSLKTKELRDIQPENNKGLNIVPQILTNEADGFIRTAEKMKSLGYNEVNLNLGCPSGTVVGKNRGSGFLALRDDLDRFLDEIFKLEGIKISIKTRIGKDEPEEFYELIKIYNKYPIEELIIHPRTRNDFYGNTPNLKVFQDAIDLSVNEVGYNGDIFNRSNYNELTNNFHNLDRVMLGRGILANPALIREIKGGKPINKMEFNEFHNEIFNGYRELFNEDRNAVYRMKELWGYMSCIFTDNKKYAKKIKKAQRLDDYRAAVESLLKEQDIIEGVGFTRNNI